jgi:hypothetical protein
MCVWLYAIKEPHDAGRFAKSVEMYQHYAEIMYEDERKETRKLLCLDCLLATIYKNSRFGTGLLDQMTDVITRWSDYFIKGRDAGVLFNLASGLKLLNDAKHEHELLRKIALASIDMNEEMHARLAEFERGPAPAKPKAPKAKDERTNPILGDRSVFAFDDEPRSWSDEQLQLFFDACGAIRYALSMDLWEPGGGRNLTLAPNIPWDNDVAFDCVIEAVMFAFRGEVACDRTEAALLLPQKHEMLDGVLLRFGGNEAKFGHTAMFVSVFKISARLEVRIYTLYEPQGSAADDKAGSLALRRSASGSQGFNPVQAAYIKEVRDVVTKAIEKAANDGGGLY